MTCLDSCPSGKWALKASFLARISTGPGLSEETFFKPWKSGHVSEVVVFERWICCGPGFIFFYFWYGYVWEWVLKIRENKNLTKNTYVIFNQSISVHLEVLLPFSQTYSIYLFSIPVWFIYLTSCCLNLIPVRSCFHWQQLTGEEMTLVNAPCVWHLVCSFLLLPWQCLWLTSLF